MINRRVLLIADAFYPRTLPPECRTNTYLASALGKRGWKVSVWAGCGARVPADSVNVNIVRSPRFWGLTEVIRIFLWLLRNAPEHVILMYHAELYSNRANITLIPVIAKLLRLRSITLFTSGVRPRRSCVQDHFLSLLGYSALLSYPVGILGASATMIFYCDENRSRLLQADPLNLKVRSRISTPPNTLPVAIDADRYRIRNSLAFTDQEFVIGYFGLIYREKGLEWLLEAVRIVKDKGLAVKLVLVGPNGAVTANELWNADCRNYELWLKSKANDLAIDDMITWSGFCDDVKAVELLSICDVVCLPFDGGLTNQRSSFITCAQIGLPVITTMTSSTDEFLRDCESGIIYVEPRNSIQIAERISSLYKDAEMRQRVGAMIKHFATQHYSNQRFVDCFETT